MLRLLGLRRCALVAITFVAVGGCGTSAQQSSRLPAARAAGTAPLGQPVPTVAVSTPTPVEHPSPIPEAIDGWKPFAGAEGVQVRVFGTKGTSVPGYVITMNHCGSWRGAVRWRTLGGEQVEYRVGYSPMTLLDSPRGTARSGYIDLPGCSQLIFYSVVQPGLPYSADQLLIDLVVDWRVWTPSV